MPMKESIMLLIILIISLLAVVIILTFEGGIGVNIQGGWTAGILNVFKFLYRPVA
jgi:hypothetical protein